MNTDRTFSAEEKQYLEFKKYIDQLPNEPYTEQIRTTIETSMKIHLELLKSKSKLSTSIPQGLKRKLLALQMSSDQTDEKFTPAFLLDRLKDLKPSLVIYLFPNNFKFDASSEVFTYDGPMKVFLKALEQGILLPEFMDLLDQFQTTFYDGNLLVEVHDHRPPIKTSQDFIFAPNYEVHRILLKPTPQTLAADLNTIKEQKGLSDDEMLALESKILLLTEKNICLDPSPKVAVFSRIIEYNKQKFNLPTKKRKVNPVSEEKQQQKFETLLLFHPAEPSKTVFQSSGFSQFSFVQEWRQTKQNESLIPNPGVDRNQKNMIRRTGNNKLKYLFRTLKFARTKAEGKHYTTLNIYLLSNLSFDLTLRWGAQPDTHIKGQQLKFNLPDVNTLEMYVNHFTNYYVKCESNELISDQKIQTDFQKMVQLLRSQETQLQMMLQQKNKGEGKSTNDALLHRQLLQSKVTAAIQQQQQQQQQQRQEQKVQLNQQQLIEEENDDDELIVPSSAAQNTNLLQQSLSGKIPPQQPGYHLLQQQMQKVEAQLPRQQPQAVSRTSAMSPPPAMSPSNATSFMQQQMQQAATPSAQTPMTPFISLSNFQQQQQQQPQQLAKPQQQQPKNRPTAEDLQRLLSTPFNQIPDAQKPLYLQLRQRLMDQQRLKQQQQQLSGNAGSPPAEMNPSTPGASGGLAANQNFLMNQLLSQQSLGGNQQQMAQNLLAQQAARQQLLRQQQQQSLRQQQQQQQQQQQPQPLLNLNQNNFLLQQALLQQQQQQQQGGQPNTLNLTPQQILQLQQMQQLQQMNLLRSLNANQNPNSANQNAPVLNRLSQSAALQQQQQQMANSLQMGLNPFMNLNLLQQQQQQGGGAPGVHPLGLLNANQIQALLRQQQQQQQQQQQGSNNNLL